MKEKIRNVLALAGVLAYYSFYGVKVATRILLYKLRGENK